MIEIISAESPDYEWATGVQVTMVLKEKPDFRYTAIDMERKDGATAFYAHIGPFVDSYVHAPGSKDGFAGASISIPLDDGTIFTAPPGEMWSSKQQECADYFAIGEVWSCGIKYPPHHYNMACYCELHAMCDALNASAGREKYEVVNRGLAMCTGEHPNGIFIKKES